MFHHHFIFIGCWFCLGGMYRQFVPMSRFRFASSTNQIVLNGRCRVVSLPVPITKDVANTQTRDNHPHRSLYLAALKQRIARIAFNANISIGFKSHDIEVKTDACVCTASQRNNIFHTKDVLFCVKAARDTCTIALWRIKPRSDVAVTRWVSSAGLDGRATV